MSEPEGRRLAVGNSDAHGKNYALLYDQPGRARLTPVYDIVSTAVYPGLTTRLVMPVAGIDDPEGVDLVSRTEMLRDAGFSPSSGQLRRDVADVLEAAQSTREIARVEGWHRPIVDEIVAVAQARAVQLTR